MYMISALFYGIDVNMNKVWTLSYVCMWNYVSMKMGIVIGELGNQDWIEINLGRTQFDKHRLAAPRLPPGNTSVLLIILSFYCDCVYWVLWWITWYVW